MDSARDRSEEIQLDDVIRLQEQYALLICIRCRTALRPGDGIVRHFRSVHKLKGNILKEMDAYWSMQTPNDPHTVELPPDGSPPVRELDIRKGYSCRGCRFLTVNRKNIIHHCASTPGHAAVGGERWTDVFLQSWSQGPYARYWVVTGEVEAGAKAGAEAKEEVEVEVEVEATASEEGSDAGWVRMLGQYEARLAASENERRRTVDGPGGIDSESTWVREMGWAKHLDGKDLTRLYDASFAAAAASSSRRQRTTTGPAQVEQVEQQRKLRRSCESFDREMARCAARLEQVPHETRRWLNSIDANKPDGRPFSMKEHESSMDRYRMYYKRFLCFCVRARWLGRAEAEDQLGIVFTDQQWEHLDGMAGQLEEEERTAAAAAINDSGYVSDGSSSSSSSSFTSRTSEDSDGQERELDRQVFLFCISSIKQKVAGKVFINPLLHFTAVLGIDGVRRAWRQAAQYTGQLAGIIWCSRLLMLEHIFEGQPDNVEDISVEVVERFTAEFRQWLADGSSTPFSTMIRWMSYGKGYRRKEGGAAKVIWDEDGKALRFLGERIAISEFRQAAQTAVHDGTKLLDELFFGTWVTKICGSIEIARIKDSLLFEGAGQSFATNGKNAWLEPGIRKVARLGRSTMWNAGRGCWKRERTAEYLSRLHSFRQALLVCTHIWAGQPGRGPEVMTMRHCDTQQLLRNVFVFDGQVLLITDRDKNKAIRGIGRKVARFLPESVGKMMIAYITWLMPFEKLLYEQTGIQGPSASLDEFLWKDARKGRWDTPELSKVLARVTGTGFGVELTVAGYRHVAIEVGRKIQGIVVEWLKLEVGEDGGEKDDGAEDPTTGEQQGHGNWDFVWDLQATHGSKIAQQHYAVNLQFPGQLQPQMMANYREISRLWHRYLEVKGEGDGDGRAVEKRASGRKRPVTDEPAGDSSEQMGLKRRRKMPGGGGGGRGKDDNDLAGDGPDEEELGRGLRLLLGRTARWRTEEQRESMKRILALEAGGVLITVLPTGGGKSILFMLPAVLEGRGTSIVVVPFVALMDDLVSRAREFGVDCLKWQPAEGEGRKGERQRAARLVVVSADMVCCEEFAVYADGLRALGALQRIFVDECHTVLMDAGYRKKLESLSGLYRYGCAVVLLTATLPVRLEGWFRVMMLAKDADIVRARTTKRNIRYRVEVVKTPGRTAVEDGTAEVVRQMEKRMVGDQKGVVYCRSRKTCEAMAAKLGCDFYHSGMPDEAKRRATLQRWAEGKGESRWIVATTGLGTGVDIGGIVGIVHMEQPYGLVDFMQQTGRGGRRDGETVESVIVHDGRPAWHDRQGSDVEQLNRQAMLWFMESVDCRRVVLGSFIDGSGQDCEQAGGELCDRCLEGRVRETENRLKRHRITQGRRLASLEGWLEEVRGKCAACWVRWYQLGRSDKQAGKVLHGLDRCPIFKKGEYLAWRRGIVFGEFACCWRCGLPQAWCGGAGRDRGRCVYMDQVLPVVMMVERSGMLQGLVWSEFEVDARDGVTYREWVGRSRRLYEMDGTNAVAVWDLIIRRICLGWKEKEEEEGRGKRGEKRS